MGRGIGANEGIVYAVWRIDDGEGLFAVETGGGSDGTRRADGAPMLREGARRRSRAVRERMASI